MPRRRDSLAMQAVGTFLHEIDVAAKGPRAISRLVAGWLPEGPKLSSSPGTALKSKRKSSSIPILWHRVIYDSIKDRFVEQGEEHLRCGAWDLIESERKVYTSKDCPTTLADMHKEVSACRDSLFTVIAASKRRRSSEVFMEAWRFKREAEYFHRTVKEETGICADMGTRGPRIIGTQPSYHHPSRHTSSDSLTVPLIGVNPPSPAPEEPGSDVAGAFDSFNPHTPLSSDYDRRSPHHEDFFSQTPDSPNGALYVLPFGCAQGSCVDDETSCSFPEPVLKAEDHAVLSTMNTFGSSAELTTATSAERSLNVNVDDEAQEVDANLDSEDELDKELLTAEIKVRTPSISSASYERSAFAMQPIQLPTLPAELMYTDPHEYVDRMLDSHGEDPRRYWEVPFSRLSPPDVLHIADTLASQGIEAAIDLIEQYSTWVRNWLAQQNYGNDQSSETETRSITSELVSPSDTMVEGSPRRALAGAVGDIPVPLQPQILSALEALSDLESFALGPAMSTPKFDDTADDAEATSDDTDSVVAWPYGPSRSTTLDNPAVGVAPDGHLGDQFAAMMMQLPGRVSAPPSGASTHVGHDIVSPCAGRQVLDFVGLKAEQPRLLSIRSSPHVKVTPLHCQTVGLSATYQLTDKVTTE